MHPVDHFPATFSTVSIIIFLFAQYSLTVPLTLHLSLSLCLGVSVVRFDLVQLLCLFADAPIFIYIHGGYWQALDKTVSAYVVEPLYKAGHKVIVLDYDLCPNISLEQLVDQIQRAGISIVNYAMSMGTRYGYFFFLLYFLYRSAQQRAFRLILCKKKSVRCPSQHFLFGYHGHCHKHTNASFFI